MTIPNGSFELGGFGYATDWGPSATGLPNTIADFLDATWNPYHATGIEVFGPVSGWPPSDETWADVTVSAAMFDDGTRPYETWWMVYFGDFADVQSIAGKFDAEAYDAETWLMGYYVEWSDVTHVAALFVGSVAYDDFPIAGWMDDYGDASWSTAMFVGPLAYESFEP